MTDWTAVDEKITKMKLTDMQLETLNCYMTGIGFVETARLMDVNNSTVWRRMKQIRNKYVDKIGVCFIKSTFAKLYYNFIIPTIYHYTFPAYL